VITPAKQLDEMLTTERTMTAHHQFRQKPCRV